MSLTRLAHDWWDRPIPDNVEIGDRSWLWSSYSFLHCRSRRPCAVRIGADSGLYAGTMFDLGPEGEVVIGSFCTLVSPVFSVAARVEIGDHVLISSRVVIADQAVARPYAEAQPPLSDSPSTRQEPGAQASGGAVVRIGSGAWIGTGAVLLAGADIGPDAIVGAASVVDGPVPPGATAGGNPYRLLRS